MINKLLFKLSARLPCRLINLDSGPYLERYYLGQLFGVTFYLHRFVSSDSERHIHNHPWNWGASLILAGSYIEERAIDMCPAVDGSGCLTDMVQRRWFNRVDGNTFHRIHDAKPGTWTLFFHGERATVGPVLAGTASLRQHKGWGFLERAYLVSDHEVTVFKPYPSKHHRWWVNGLTGEETGRQPLNDTINPMLREWSIITASVTAIVAYGWSDLVEWLT